MDYSTSNVSTEEIGRVATHEDVKSRALSIVKKKLGHFLGKADGSEVLSMAIYFDPPLANKIDPPFIV